MDAEASIPNAFGEIAHDLSGAATEIAQASTILHDGGKARPVRPRVSFDNHGHSQENIGGKSIMASTPPGRRARKGSRFVAAGRKPPPAGPSFGCQCHRHLATTGADVSRRHPRHERNLLREPGHLGSTGTEAKAPPALAAHAEDHAQDDDGPVLHLFLIICCLPSVARSRRCGPRRMRGS